MILAGNTPIVVNEKLTRPLSREFNRALKAAEKAGIELVVYYGMETNAQVVPSKGLSWSNVAAFIRSGKKVQARLEQPKKPIAA